MMFGFGKRSTGLGTAIEEGVTEGLQSAFAPGGGAFKAFEDALAPVFAEMRELRRYKARHQWRPMKDAPPWLMDGRTVLVARHGDAFWASYQTDEDGGYWDADLEYGGTAIEPPPTHFLILPKTPVDEVTQEGVATTSASVGEATDGEAVGRPNKKAQP